MALNKTIIKKVKTKTEKETEIGNFLVRLLEFESEASGWWKTKYNSILEETCKEEKRGCE